MSALPLQSTRTCVKHRERAAAHARHAAASVGLGDCRLNTHSVGKLGRTGHRRSKRALRQLAMPELPSACEEAGS
eukprot:361349-Chlamydomonas_euryale.AAC.2